MEEIHGTLFTLMVVWGVITAVLVCLIIYRGTLDSVKNFWLGSANYFKV